MIYLHELLAHKFDHTFSASYFCNSYIFEIVAYLINLLFISNINAVNQLKHAARELSESVALLPPLPPLQLRQFPRPRLLHLQVHIHQFQLLVRALLSIKLEFHLMLPVVPWLRNLLLTKNFKPRMRHRATPLILPRCSSRPPLHSKASIVALHCFLSPTTPHTRAHTLLVSCTFRRLLNSNLVKIYNEYFNKLLRK